jgi:hypothetical protein
LTIKECDGKILNVPSLQIRSTGQDNKLDFQGGKMSAEP